jgi:hypothetical protein
MSPRRAFLVGTIGFFLLGLPWLMSTPLMGAPDEPAHTIRAAAIVRGDAFGLQQEIGSHRGVRITGVHYRVYLPESWASLPLVSSCYAGNPERLPDCARSVREGTKTLPVATAAGRYPPPYYAGVGLPSLVVDPVPGVYLMRAVSLLLAAAMVGIAASALAINRARPLGFAALAVALTPMAPFLAASVNPNGVEIVAAIATWVTGLQLFRPGTHDRRLVPLFVAAAATFALARPTSPLFLTTVVIAILVARGRRDRLVELWREPVARRWLLALAGVVVIAVVWTVATGALQSFGGVGRPDLTQREIFDESWDYTSRRIHQMVAWFGWLDSPGPLSLLHGWEVVTVAMAAVALVLGTWRVRVVLLLTVAGILVLPLAAEVMSAQRIGFAWQGRYTLPVAVGLPLLAGDTLEQRVTRWQWPVTMALLVFWAIGHGLGHVAALRRLLDGYPAPLLRFLSDPATSWRPTLGIIPTLVSGAVAALVCAAVLGWLATVTQQHPLDRSPS